jgi:hypothetical protein
MLYNSLKLSLLGAVILLVGTLGNGFAGDDSFSIAREKDITGKYVSGACLSYAQDLYSRMTQAGGEAHLVVFDWTSANNSGKHAIVVYRDKEGRYWGMDNLKQTPIWLAGTTPREWADFFAPRCDVVVKAHKTDLALAGQYADRSRSVAVAKKSPKFDTLLATK